MNDALIPLLPSIRRFAYSLTGSAADADDLLQNTVERLLTRPIPEDVELLKWAFRVCRNLWIDEYRARKVRQPAKTDEPLQDGVIDGEAQIHQQLTVCEVDAAMGTLPDEQRAVLALVVVQGMAYREVAEILQVPVGTVMSRLARARIALVQHFHITSGGAWA